MVERSDTARSEAITTCEDEAVLVAEARHNRVAFGRLYELHVHKIYNYIYYRTWNHHDAEDLTAKVFFKALEHMGRYQDRGAPFSAWLYRIAHNVVANWHRDSRRSETVALEEVAGQLGQGDDPHWVTERSEAQQRLVSEIRVLPSARQQLLILKFVAHLGNREIGEIMGRSEGAIKSLYHRTLVALRKGLSDDEQGQNGGVVDR